MLERAANSSYPCYRVSHIRCSTARHARGCAACPRREQGKETLKRLAAVKTRSTIQSLFPVPFSGKMTLSLDVSDQSPGGPEANRHLSPDERDGSRYHPRRSCAHAWERRCGILDADQICSQRSVFRERKPPLQKLQMWNAVLSMRQYSRILSNFRFRLCVSFRGGSVFQGPSCTSTSDNHFASRCDISDGSPIF
jgi:hypothetical protein